MPDQVRGEAALIETNLPAAVNIASSTNASPVVVTTSTAHGIVTGDYLRIAGAAQAALNGDWLAGATASSTQVQLLAIPDGSNSAAPGGTGGAAGTLQSLGFGEDNSYSIPVDIADARDAASVNVAFLNLGARTALLLYQQKTAVDRLVVLEGDGTCARVQTPADVTEWEITESGDGEAVTGNWQTSTAAVTSLFSEFTDITNGVTLTGATVYIHPAGAHAGLPAVMPTLELTALDVTTGARTSLGTATDSSANTTAYQLRHTITMTFGAPFAFDQKKHRVMAVVVSEHGANALAGMRVGGATIAW